MDLTAWRVLVAETVTGHVVADVRASAAPRFERRLNEQGTWSVDVYFGYGGSSAEDLHEWVETGRYSWAVVCGDQVMQAGPVRTWQVSDEQRQLTVSGAGIAAEFDRRIVRNPRGHTAITDPSEDLVLRDLSVRGLMSELVRANLAQRGYALPIVLPGAEPGPESITHYGYDLAFTWDRLHDLTQRDGGPEFEFRPRLVDGGRRLEWSMEIGRPRLGDQAAAVTWDYGTAIGPLDLDVDGSRSPVSRVWVKGAGGGRELLTGVATAERPGTPPVDAVDTSHVAERRQDLLESYARAVLAGGQSPATRWETTLRLGQPGTGLGEWSLGDAPLIAVPGHPWLGDGLYRRRITGISDADETAIALDLDALPAP
ncbi:hypothetical protein ACH347_14745 [Saccharopolyspora sp. 5N102]|uniref:hypothetical protein n=1 Tax=Saccharopolyspora sp. 5N102 TaxID=3375155 RepID=UPI0037B962EF